MYSPVNKDSTRLPDKGPGLPMVKYE